MERIDLSKGFIFLPRTIIDSWIWDNPTHIQLWIDMVCRASWRDYVDTVNGKQVILKRGEFRMSLYSICKKYDLDKRAVKRFLNTLERKKWIEIGHKNNITIYYIVDIDYYQPCTKENIEQNVPLEGGGSMNGLYPKCTLYPYPNMHPNVYPSKGNEGNGVSHCFSDNCNIRSAPPNEGSCTHLCTQNCTYDVPKNVPTYNNKKNNKNIFNNNNDNNTNGRVGERVCERVGERVREREPNDVYGESYPPCNNNSNINLLSLVKNDSVWIEAVRTVFDIDTVEEVELSLKLFWSDLIAKGSECHESPNDFKSHYYAWMRIQQGMEEKRKLNEERSARYNDFNDRKPAPISTEIPKSSDFRF